MLVLKISITAPLSHMHLYVGQRQKESTAASMSTSWCQVNGNQQRVVDGPSVHPKPSHKYKSSDGRGRTLHLMNEDNDAQTYV